MNSEWIRFGITCFLLVAALVGFTAAVIGAYRFGFVMNRMHAAAIGDTLGLMLGAIGLIILKGISWFSLKMLLVVVLLWMTSAISSHVIMRMSYSIDEDVKDEVTVER